MSTLGRLGSYELVRKIAAGGMAEIFLARQWGSAGFFHEVVIKRLFRHLAEHPTQLRMFQDEGRLLAALSHANIPQVYDVGHADGYWYIAMEHVEGYTLADAFQLGVRNGLPMPLPVAMGIVMQTCEALHHAHERADRAHRPLRIVHRDVTPQNVMLTRDGVAKLMDFGVASTAARKDTEAGAVRGTFAYMAPEQIRARPLDKRADVFALGVILYELTTGSRLFRGSDVQVMTQVVEQDVAPPSARDPNYPADLEEVVMAALARDRSKRMPSTAHLAVRLEELAQRYGVLVGPRAVARWVGQVLPAEPLREDELAMVQPPDLGSDHGGYGAPPPRDELGDEDGMMEDLRLLSLPPEPLDHELADMLGELPPEQPAMGDGMVDPVDVDFDGDLDDGFDDLLSQPPQQGEVYQAFDHGEPPSADTPLTLDGFEDHELERPVLLLDAPKRPTSAPTHDAQEGAGRSHSEEPRSQRRGVSFMDELERKLIEDLEEPSDGSEDDDRDGTPR